MRHVFYVVSGLVFAIIGLVTLAWPPAMWSLIGAVPVFGLGVWDALQTRKAVLRNFPVIGHFRYLLEMIRPEINQYFIESNTDGRPFSRELRSLAYRRAKQVRETVPFGTQSDVYAPGYEWINHSMAAVTPLPEVPRVRIGSEQCAKPYDAALYNISAMSFGSLSANAIRALNRGAARGGFFHNTGEGGVSPHHLQGGGDLVWQIGTGYFGCRDKNGNFDDERFTKTAPLDRVKMIEIKLSQGAKPGHGGILPAAKVTPEIAEIRGVPLDKDVISPPAHTAFNSPKTLLEFVAKLRKLSEGKPIGLKLCIGHRSEFLGLCKAMWESGIVPDFISVDGGEGGTGAAPVEFSDSVGAPLTDGLVFVHNALVGFDLRQQIKIIASGKIITGFHIAQRLAVGADLCSSARGFMFSLGCIQALRCNSNDCPVGVATQNPRLAKGLVVTDKASRVAAYQRGTVHGFLEALGAAGMRNPADLRPWHIHRRVSPSEVKKYSQIFDYLEAGSLLEEPYPEGWKGSMKAASAEHFRPPQKEVRAVDEVRGLVSSDSAKPEKVAEPVT